MNLESNNDIVALAVFILGGAVNQVDIEFVADKAYELAPSKFCWKHFPRRIDLRVVQYALKNACKEESAKITGSIRHGYQMTPEGIEWAERISSQGISQVEATRAESQGHIVELERKRLRHSIAFAKFAKGEQEEITRRDFQAFVRINEYFPPNLKSERIQRVANVAEGQSDLRQLWQFLEQRFLEVEHG
jgi:hypothetical protein